MRVSDVVLDGVEVAVACPRNVSFLWTTCPYPSPVTLAAHGSRVRVCGSACYQAGWREHKCRPPSDIG